MRPVGTTVLGLCAALCGGGAWAQDAAPAAEAPVRLDATPRVGDREGALVVRVRFLDQLARGQDELPISISSLFSIDLADDDAVAARVRAIDNALESLADVAETSTGTEDYQARLRAYERRGLQLERAFLTQPAALRKARLDSDRAKQLALQERAEAEATAARASKAAKAAEAESLRTAQEARDARVRAVRSLKTRSAAISTARAALARLESDLAREWEAKHSEQLAFVRQTRTLVLEVKAGTSSTSPLRRYDLTKASLQHALDELAEGLGTLDAKLPMPSVDRSLPVTGDTRDPQVRAAVTELETALLNLDREAAEIRGGERARRHVALEGYRGPAETLREALFVALRALDPAARWQVRNPLDKGLAGARLELRFLALDARALLRTRLFALEGDQEWVEVSRLVLDGAKVALIFMLVLWVSRRIRGLTAWLDRYQLLSRHSLSWHRRARSIARNVERLVPLLAYLAGLWGAHALLVEGRGWPDIDLVYLVAWWLGILWLLKAAVGAFVLWLVARRRVRIESELRTLIHGTTSALAWVVFAFGLLHDVIVLILGRGVLYLYAEGLLYVLLAFTAILIVQRWRGVIADAYLTTSPEGRLANLVRTTADRWYGFFVALTAFAWVLVRSLSTLASEALMSLDEVRSALAYVFRKQLERRAEEVAGWDGDLDRLPEKLRKAFTTAPLDDDVVCVDRFPGLDHLQQQLEQWKKTAEGGTFLLRGRRGFGKSTWLRRAQTKLQDELPTRRIDLRRDGGGLFEQLSAKLAHESDVPFEDIDALQAHLLNGKKRVLLVDDFHRLLRRQLGGLSPLDEMLHLMHTTRRRVFWVVAVDDHAWRFATAARPHRLRFRHEESLRAWPENAIVDMLMARAAASGIVHRFEDLVTDPERGGAQGVALARASEAYTRLIWDYAGGNPMVAAHFWMRSLVPITGSQVRVRLFRGPDEDILGDLPDDWTFMLGAIAQHETLSPREAATVLGLSEDACAAAFEHLRQDGLLERPDSSPQMTLTTYWKRAVERHLSQRHLL